MTQARIEALLIHLRRWINPDAHARLKERPYALVVEEATAGTIAAFAALAARRKSLDTLASVIAPAEGQFAQPSKTNDGFHGMIVEFEGDMTAENRARLKARAACLGLRAYLLGRVNPDRAERTTGAEVWRPDRRHGIENPFCLLSEYLADLLNCQTGARPLSKMERFGLGVNWDIAADNARVFAGQAGVTFDVRFTHIEKVDAVFTAVWSCSETGPGLDAALRDLEDAVIADQMDVLAMHTQHAWATRVATGRAHQPQAVAKDPHHPLLVVADKLRLKGKQYRLIELLASATGPVPLADVGLALEWLDDGIWRAAHDGRWNSIRDALNEKLKSHRWYLVREDNKVKAMRLPDSSGERTKVVEDL
ncbi:MAG: hypothetical protein L0241_14680 [Planctomycetia bacterium]|nr:hypothetical protein [Planctomycetia bacterium]